VRPIQLVRAIQAAVQNGERTLARRYEDNLFVQAHRHVEDLAGRVLGCAQRRLLRIDRYLQALGPNSLEGLDVGTLREEDSERCLRVPRWRGIRGRASGNYKRPERVNDFAAPGVMNLLCKAAVVGRYWSSPLVAG